MLIIRLGRETPRVLHDSRLSRLQSTKQEVAVHCTESGEEICTSPLSALQLCRNLHVQREAPSLV